MASALKTFASFDVNLIDRLMKNGREYGGLCVESKCHHFRLSLTFTTLEIPFRDDNLEYMRMLISAREMAKKYEKMVDFS